MALSEGSKKKKTTFLLKQHTLDSLDAMKEEGQFGSRDGVIEVVTDLIAEIRETVAKAESERKSASTKLAADPGAWSVIAYNSTNALNEISRQLSRLGGKAKR
jgi:Arc/MetJ-type ribon-helix-helix transcriptional regulator